MFDRLKDKGFIVQEYVNPETAGTEVIIKKGDLTIAQRLNYKDRDCPTTLMRLEKHIEQQFESEAKRKIDKMALTYGVSGYGPKHISHQEYDYYVRECMMRNMQPDPMVRPMYEDKIPEPAKPKVTKPKPTNKMLLVIKGKK